MYFQGQDQCAEQSVPENIARTIGLFCTKCPSHTWHASPPFSTLLVSCYISFREIDLLINGANNICSFCWYPVKMFTRLLARGMCYKCYRIQVWGVGEIRIFCIWKLYGHYPTGHGFVDRSSISGWQIHDRTMLDLLAFSWTLWGE